jgi:hypothetical protein
MHIRGSSAALQYTATAPTRMYASPATQDAKRESGEQCGHAKLCDQENSDLSRRQGGGKRIFGRPLSLPMAPCPLQPAAPVAGEPNRHPAR